MRVLYRGGVMWGPVRDWETGARATCLATDGETIVMVGHDDRAAAYDGADEIVDLHGALVLPAFVDAHVHTVQAGFRLTDLDLHGSPTLADTLDRVAAHAAARPGEVVVGQGWDETRWAAGRPPSAAELERAAPGRAVFVSRVDGHSAVVSPALAASVPDLADHDGWAADGRVERDAHHAVRAVLAELVGDEQRLAAARAACRRMAAVGIVGFHENAAPHIGPASEIELVRRAAAAVGLRPTVYWGELETGDGRALARAAELGAAGLAGDLNADGALGSRTAALTTPYADRPDHHGHAYLTVEQVADHVAACTRAGRQAGFHAIGEVGVQTVAGGFAAAAERVGDDALRAARHRVEHVEMASPEAIATLGRLGVTASVQPVFDALWGGPAGMYAERVGDRWRGMNALAGLAAATPVALGSDSPVTELGPWAAVRAAVRPHEPAHALTTQRAVVAHTRAGWYAAGDDRSGVLTPHRRADLAIWRVDGELTADGLPDLTPGRPLPTLVRTVAAGRTIHEETS